MISHYAQRAVIGIVAVSIALTILFRTVDSTFFSRGKPTTNSAQVAPGTSPPPGTVVPATGPSTAAVTSNVRDQLWEASKLLSTAAAHMEEASRDIASWEREIVPLGNGPAGQAIASNTDLVQSLAALRSEDRVLSEAITRSQLRVSELRRSLDAAAKALNPQPLTSREMSEIRELAQTADSARRQWRDAVDRGRAIQREGARMVTPVAAMDLEAKVKEQQDKATLDQFEKERQWKEKLAEEQKKRDAEMAQAKAEAEAEALRLKQELIKRAEAPEVASLLAPFFHSRDVQPQMSGGSLKLRKTFDSKPMSLSALNGMGALSPDLEGLKRLAKAGGDRELAAPKWSVHSQPYNWSESDKEMLQEAQRTLREFGPVLVELGKLSP